MNFIQKHKINRHLSRFVRRRRREDMQVCSLERACGIGVVCSFESPQRLEQLIEGVRAFQNDKNRVAIYCFVPKGEKISTENYEEICFISEKDFDFKGSLRKEKLLALRGQSFDILIDINEEASLFSLYLLTEINAKFRIGKNKNCKEYYDVLLYSPREDCRFEDYFQAINTYTKKIIQQ
ncbi:MAG: hypothetical protein FWH36_07160 [Lentimicrobiaceae bacterium]|nr:hypothetical protein [Lentimicrobiaceae bacterium]